jgi:hypothetical protein
MKMDHSMSRWRALLCICAGLAGLLATWIVVSRIRVAVFEDAAFSTLGVSAAGIVALACGFFVGYETRAFELGSLFGGLDRILLGDVGTEAVECLRRRQHDEAEEVRAGGDRSKLRELAFRHAFGLVAEIVLIVLDRAKSALVPSARIDHSDD